MEDWNEKIIDYSIDKIYNIFNKYCYKSNILDIPDNLNDFLEQESIILDEYLGTKASIWCIFASKLLYGWGIQNKGIQQNV